MSIRIHHVSGTALWQNRHQLTEFVSEALSPHVNDRTWMRSTYDLARRFGLLSFVDKAEAECRGYDWDSDLVEATVSTVIQRVQQLIPLERVEVMVVPALPFPWFRQHNLPQSRWSNAFTNGPGNLVVAVPPQPDWNYLANLIAHECHHASPENPIYQLTLESFTMAEWLKMEGVAEYFSLYLYPDERWWWPSFPNEQETSYWTMLEPHLNTVDDAVKGRLAFGSKSEGIPTFAGYTFGYRVVAHYVQSNPGVTFQELFKVSPFALINTYMAR